MSRSLINNRNTSAWKALRRARLAVAEAGQEPCCLCGKAIDYQLPGNVPAGPTVHHLDLVMHTGTEQAEPERLGPAHNGCNARHGARAGNAQRARTSSAPVFRGGGVLARPRTQSLSPQETFPEQGVSTGYRPADALVRTEDLLESWPDWLPTPPDDQVLPRVLTPPHPRAVGSYGPEILEWARPRFGMHPKVTTGHRYWQELTLCMAHQHDEDGDLLPATVLLGTARQCGKSWTLREAALWRLDQAKRWGELQTVIHAAAKLSQAEAVWNPAAHWASRLPRAGKTRAAGPPGLWDLPEEGPQVPLGNYSVRRANGSAGLARDDGSAWIPQAATDQLGVSLSVSLAIVDEAWDVPRWIVDNGLVPTQAEARSPQLWLVSTAGRPKTGEVSDLYQTYRAEALTDHDSTVILEWSADPDADPADPHTWRQASPHWDERRAALLEREWRKAQKSTAALATFKMQWLNIWPDLADAVRWLPKRLTDSATRDMLDAPSHAVAAIETSYADPSQHAVALAWSGEGGRIYARVWLLGNLPDALAVAADRQLWTHAAIAETIGPRRWGTQAINAAQGRAATATLRQVLRTGTLAVAGLPDAQWESITTTVADGGEYIDARRSSGDIHGAKALSWAVWAVESGRSHTGFLFGARPDDAHPGARTA